MSKFKKAEKKKSKLRLGFSGPSGSGKTYSALRIAKGLGLKTALIDSERGSASLYSDQFNFDVLEIGPPYSTEKYQEALNDAAKEGYELVIIDSISHAWAGEGGLLNQKEQLDSRGGNSFANWAKMTPKQEKFINTIVSSPMHVIVTMRSKQDYSISDEGGKKKIQKVGLAPIQRDGFEYELTTVFDVAMDHQCASSKDRTGLFVDKIFQITEETGSNLKNWLASGKEHEQELELEQNNTARIGVDNLNANIEKENSNIVYTKEHIPNVDTKSEPPLFDSEEKMPDTPELVPNFSRGTYIMIGGRYHGLVIGKMNKIDLNKYVQSCIAHTQETNTSLPMQVVENISAIKEFLGMK